MTNRKKFLRTVWSPEGRYCYSSLLRDYQILDLYAKGYYSTPGESDAEEEEFDLEKKQVVPRKTSPAKPRLNGLFDVPEGTWARVKGRKYFPDTNGEILFEGTEGFEEELEVELFHPSFKKTVLTVPLEGVSPGATNKIKQDYSKRRLHGYPNEREQIGALVKAVKALMNNETIPEDALRIIEEVDTVKMKFPKPNTKGKK